MSPRKTAQDSAADLWMKQMARLEVLSKEDQIHLARVIQKGKAVTEQGETYTPKARRAIQKMVAHNLRLVVHLWDRKFSQRIGPNDPALPDLLQEGACGLQRAAQLFDHTKGYAFSTYAHWWIIKGFGDYFRNQERTVRMPSHAVCATERARKQLNEYEQLGVKVTDKIFADLAASLKTKPKTLQTYLTSYRVTQTMSGDMVCKHRQDETGATMLELYESPEPQPESDSPAIKRDFELVAARAHLDPHERDMLLAIAQGFGFNCLDDLFPDHAPCRRKAISAQQRFRHAAVESQAELTSLCEA